MRLQCLVIATLLCVAACSAVQGGSVQSKGPTEQAAVTNVALVPVQHNVPAERQRGRNLVPTVLVLAALAVVEVAVLLLSSHNVDGWVGHPSSGGCSRVVGWCSVVRNGPPLAGEQSLVAKCQIDPQVRAEDLYWGVFGACELEGDRVLLRGGGCGRP